MKLKKIDALDKPYQIYAEVLESGAIDQFVDVMGQADVRQGALMADAHSGYVLPIGGVVATEGTIYPSFVGYDIGCGVCAVKMNIKREQIWDKAAEIRDAIYKQIPVGFNKNPLERHARVRKLLKELKGNPTKVITEDLWGEAVLGCGTLGGGNHFIEIGYDESDDVWIIVHSGSRSLGFGVGEHYMKLAAGRDRKFEGLYSLHEHSDVGKDYINDLDYCLAYALLSRKIMVSHTCNILKDFVKGAEAIADTWINRNHNHAEKKGDVWIHRKGATHAELGMMGVIPGNMRDGCFITRGKGNPASLYSSSHGAGRVMSRAKAKEAVNLEQLVEMMKDVPGASVRPGVIDEAPAAYKNIFEVMELQKDLLEVVHHVKPIVNVKG